MISARAWLLARFGGGHPDQGDEREAPSTARFPLGRLHWARLAAERYPDSDRARASLDALERREVEQ